MCGILVTDLVVDEQTFRRALGLLADRGPDAEGHRCVDGVNLGHRRLKVLDLDDRSNQPMRSRDGRHLIVYNGEVYNFAELAKEWKIPTKTTSDTEVILELFSRLGSRMLPLLNGMFSIVIFDAQSKEFFVARDRLGIKPLYWARTPAGVVFSSEIAPILELGVDPGIDEIGLRQYLKLRGCFNGRTIYRSIETFPPGHFMENGRIQRYWELPEGEQSPPSDEELRVLLEGSIRRRLVSDVPVGTFLSGGLDSSIITAVANPADTWTVGMSELNEFDWARRVAVHLSTDHHEVIVDAFEFPHLVEKMVRRCREPLSVPNEVLLYRMSREAKKTDTVLLSGEGADELFFGYDRIFRWAADAEFWDHQSFAGHYAYGSHEDDEIVEETLDPFVRKYKTPLQIVAAFFQVAHLHGLLRRLDRPTMMCGLEARVPFVDHEVIERLAGIPFASKMQDGLVKAPLKRAFSGWLPDEVIHRQKVGFPVPLDEIDFPTACGRTGYDRFLDFNLSVLGIEHNRGRHP